MDGLVQGADCELVKICQRMDASRFDNIMLRTRTKTVSERALPVGIEVTITAAEECENGSSATVAAPAAPIHRT